MKLKYHIPSPENSVRIFAFILAVLVLSLMIQPAHAYSLSSSVSNKAIFKCQPTTIYANITNDIDTVTGINVWVNSTYPVITSGGQYSSANTQYAMATTGGNIWTSIYGNDATLLYGNKTVSFVVTDSAGTHINVSATSFYVYSDVCTGTGITNYSQVPYKGLGHYTSMLWTSNDNLLVFALAPWLEYWGYEFYLIIIFLACISIYMKTQKIVGPILIAVVSLGILATTTLPIIPDEFRQYIVMILGISVGGILYKIFKG